MFGEKHWNSGAIIYLDTLTEGMVDYQRLGDLKFEEICWNWSCCRFTWQSRRLSEITSRTEQGGCLGCSVLYAGLSFGRRGLVYICLRYWVVGTDVVGGFYRFCPYVVHSVIYKKVLSQPSFSYGL